MMSELSNPTLSNNRYDLVPFTGTSSSGSLGAPLHAELAEETSRTPVGVLALTIFTFGLGLSLACFSMVWYIAAV